MVHNKTTISATKQKPTKYNTDRELAMRLNQWTHLIFIYFYNDSLICISRYVGKYVCENGLK